VLLAKAELRMANPKARYRNIFKGQVCS